MWSVWLLLAVHAAFADEPVRISEILADPDAFHLHQVTIEGVVGRVHPLDPYFLPSGVACYGAYTFLLGDELDESVLHVVVLGICGPPLPRDPEVSEGDAVTIRADIQVPNRFGEFRDVTGRVILKGEQPPVQAVARGISRRSE